MADTKPNSPGHDSKGHSTMSGKGGGAPGKGGKGGGGSGGSATAAPVKVGSRGWRDAWPLPALIVGVALLGWGLSKWAGQKPGPDFPGAMASVQTLINEAKYEEALAMLNDPIARHLSDPVVTEEIREQYHLLSADALAFAQKSRGLNVAANHQQIVDLYLSARQRYHATLDGRRTVNLAESFLALGRVDEAMQEIKAIPDALSAERRVLLRRIIDHRVTVQGAGATDENLMDTLSRFRDDPSASEQDRAWAVARQTRMRLDSGFPEESVRRLLPEIQRLESRLSPEAGELLLLLGRAYFEMGDATTAEEHLKRAEQALPESAESLAEAKVLLGRIAQSHSDLESAKDHFTLVTTRFARAPITVRAWLGLGEVEADLGDEQRSIEAYERAVETVRAGWVKAGAAGTPAASSEPAVPPAPPGVGEAESARDATNPARKLAIELDASLGQRFRDRLQKGQFEAASKYAALAERLFPADRAPPEVPLRLAEISRAAAESLIPLSARGLEGGDAGPPDLSQIDPVSREEAKRRFYESAMAYQRHAKAALISDPDASAESLWLSADCYDLAGEQDRAVDGFVQYIQTQQQGPRRLIAQYRLARTLQSMGQYKKAIPLLEDIIENAPVSDEAAMSLIPLAQCYLLASGDADAPQAEARLLQIVEGKQFEPTARQFRLAVIELGRMYRRIGDYPKAIERLTEAVARYPDLEKDAAIQSALADSYRLSAATIAEQLKNAMPQNERTRLTRLQRERLEAALDLYDRVRGLLEALDPRRTSELEKLTLRNAMFYRGDCAYDLGEFYSEDKEKSRGYYQQAIRSYDAAAQRYADDPSSLAAMMQIVSAYAALGRWTEAQTAQNRAKARLKELPPEAWANASGPMDKQHWERWLESSVKLDKLASQEQGEATPSP
ncbi:MAG: tetratricopeptide repeat protein [Phycisphaerales bacterium]